MNPRFAPWIVRLAALWLLGVSSIKLFKGTPASLPPFFAEGWFGPDLNFRLSIVVELVLGLGALVAPRVMVLPLAALYTLFVGVLIVLLGQGAESCGCFGGALKFPPALMLAIDGPLLIGLLASRAWKGAFERRPPLVVLALTTLLGAAAPFLLIPRAEVSTSPDHTTPERPRYVVLDPPSWIGKPLADSVLARWLDVPSLPGDAHFVLYRVDCDHCREALRALERSFLDDPKVYVLVAMRETGDEERRVVDVLPPGELVDLPGDVIWHITPPWELVVEGGVVVSAKALATE
ncbi:MAG: hypothetical protein NTV21_09305 [Planctomycetota bacterium]|nr:hypothetical protein [Planctomycetota bacterium]